jgi:hypothetical protein
MRTCLLPACLALIVGAAAGQVVINEFQYDDAGTDDREFVEIYNSGPPVDIAGWYLEGLDQAWTATCPWPPTLVAPCDNNAEYIVPAGGGPVMLATGGYYVFGTATVPNVNQVVGTTNLWENDVETLILRNAAGVIMDAVRYEGNKIGSTGFLTYPNTIVEGSGIWGNFTSSDGSPQSWARWTDGRDLNNNGYDFGLLPATPGASNNVVASALPYFDDFNAAAAGSPIAAWVGSFLGPIVIDPTVAGPLVPPANTNMNPNPIAASPNGGNCMIMWDNAGGGDTAHLLTVPASDFSLEAYVYIDAAPRVVNESEQWSIGMRGTSESFFNFMSPGMMNVNNANGNTGIHWHYTVDQFGGTLRLVDDNDGGDDEVVLSTIAITLGVNDGWQRIKLEVVGNQIEAIFGGTYGSITSGTRILATTNIPSNVIGTVYVGYREFITANVNTRPLTLDAVTVRVPHLTKSVNTISAATGGVVTYGLHAGPAQGGFAYALLLSTTPGDPGPFIGPPHNTLIPIVPDQFTILAINTANVDPLFANFLGVLDAVGEATASTTVPVVPGVTTPIPIYLGYVNLLNPTQLNGFSSNQIEWQLVP